jgi:hypothetical protein
MNLLNQEFFILPIKVHGAIQPDTDEYPVPWPGMELIV